MSTFLLEQLSRTKVHKKKMWEGEEGRGRHKTVIKANEGYLCYSATFFIKDNVLVQPKSWFIADIIYDLHE